MSQCLMAHALAWPLRAARATRAAHSRGSPAHSHTNPRILHFSCVSPRTHANATSCPPPCLTTQPPSQPSAPLRCLPRQKDQTAQFACFLRLPLRQQLRCTSPPCGLSTSLASRLSLARPRAPGLSQPLQPSAAVVATGTHTERSLATCALPSDAHTPANNRRQQRPGRGSASPQVGWGQLEHGFGLPAGLAAPSPWLCSVGDRLRGPGAASGLHHQHTHVNSPPALPSHAAAGRLGLFRCPRQCSRRAVAAVCPLVALSPACRRPG